jgi:hypothetical protein
MINRTQGLVTVRDGESLIAEEQQEIQAEEEKRQKWKEAFTSELAAYIRNKYFEFRRHRERTALHERMIAAMHAYNGQYSASQLHEIKQVGGSSVFARLTAIKCRGATAMLRDVYLSGARPWEVNATPEATLPEDLLENIHQLVQMEAQTLISSGQEVSPQQLQERTRQLARAAKQAVQKEAGKRARSAEKAIDDKLIEGNFYEALGDFLIDLPIFPLAVIKGPVMQMDRRLVWEDGQPSMKTVPRMFWRRVSPFDLYWTPAASSLDEADMIERIRLRRSDLQALLGLPGYDDKAIKEALSDYTTGYYEFFEPEETERAHLEDKETPYLNESSMIDGLEFQGEVPGYYLQQWNNGEVARKISGFDPAFDYNVTAWLVGRYVIKAHVQPNPRRRHNYYGTSFEKVAGSMTGHGLPEILDDAQTIANSTFRSLVNNMSLSSGPQIAINEERISPATDPDTFYPFKRWRFMSDPMGNSEKPIDFFQPDSNAQELLAVFDKMMALADEVSGIPRYLTGNQNVSGAASTASGLGMLMNNASKVMQQVAAQIDANVLSPLLEDMYTLVVLTDPIGTTWGDATVKARGVSMAMAKEADRQRQLEFLQIITNPVDLEIIGPERRARILRKLDDSLGINEDIVPDEEELAMQQQQQQQMAAMAAQAQGAQAPQPGAADNRVNRGLDNAQRTRSPEAMARQSQP